MASIADELSEVGEEKYSHHGVIFTDLKQNRDNDCYCSGTLYIKEYSDGIFIEWIQTVEKQLSVESQEQGWAVVNPVQSNAPNPVDGAESVPPSKVNLPRTHIQDIKSYKITNHMQKLAFMLKDGSRISPFLFQNDNANKFIDALSQYLSFEKSRKEPNLYCVSDVDGRLQKSFAELNLPLNDVNYTGWNFLGNSYEKTMTLFSKMTNNVLNHNSIENVQDVVNAVREVYQLGWKPPAITNQADDEYEVISSEPIINLPERPSVTRGPPLSMEEWAKHIDDKGRIVNMEELKKKIFRGGILPVLRYDVWKVLLGYMPIETTSEESMLCRKKKVEEYYQMKLQWTSLTPDQESRFAQFHKRKSLIEKDVNRTDRTIPYFEGNDNPNLKIMYDILMTYVMYNFDLGYVQGMSDLLSPILYLMEKEEDAFWCFVGFMNKVCDNFAKDQLGMKVQLLNLNALIRVADPELGRYLENNESDNLFFCFRWLLILFKREFSFQDIMNLWEVLWTDLPGPNFHLFICLAILDTEKEILMENHYGFTEILKHINDLSLHIHLEDILTKAEAIYLQLSSATNLPNSIREILGMPSLSPENGEDSADEVFSPASDHVTTNDSQPVNEAEWTCAENIENMYEESLNYQL